MGYNLALLTNHRFFTKRLSIIFFSIQINASRKPCFPAFHRKKSRGNLRLRYSTLRLFVPWTIRKFFTKFCTNRSVIYKMTSSWTQSRARGLSWFGSRARLHALRCTSSDLHSTNKKTNIFMFRTHFDIFIIQAYTTIWSIIRKNIENK